MGPGSPPRGRAVGGGTAPDPRRPSQRRTAPPPGTPFRHPDGAQRRPARARAVGPVLGPHTRTDRTRDTRVAEPRLPAPEDGRPGEGQRLTPDAPQNGGRPSPPGTAPHHPHGTQPPQGMQARGTVLGPHTHTSAPTARGRRTPTARPVSGQSGEGERLTSDAPRNNSPKPGRGEPGPDHPPPSKHASRSEGPGQDTRRGTDHVERPYQRPVPGTRNYARHTTPGGGGGRRGSGSAHTRKGHAGTTRRATRPSSRNAQTAWNGVPASEGMGYQDGRVRHTQRGTRGAGWGKRERHNTRYRPEPPEPAASAAHTRTGHCTRQGSSGALRHAPIPRLGSLRASPRGSHWRQASSTGPAAPAPRATTH